MCKCLKCLAVLINVIILLLGLVLAAVGIYAYAKIDFHKLIGKQVGDKIPHAVGEHAGGNDVIKEKLDVLANTCKTVFLGVMVFGLALAVIAIMGIMAFTCCNKKKCCLALFMILLIILLIPFAVLTYFVWSKTYIQDKLFDQLDKIALKKDMKNRLFMAALQVSLKCCAVRGPEDYFCNNIYDYSCNAGCKILPRVWNGLYNKLNENKPNPPIPPMCINKKETIEGRRIEISQKPIEAKGQKICNNYKEHKGGRSSNFKDYDPARNQPSCARLHREDCPIIIGSPFFPRNSLDETLYTGAPTKGCGYQIWNDSTIGLNKKLTLAGVILLVIVCFLAFEVILVIISCCRAKKDKH